MGPDDGILPLTYTENRFSMRSYGPLTRYAEDLWPVQKLIFDPEKLKLLLYESPEKV